MSPPPPPPTIFLSLFLLILSWNTIAPHLAAQVPTSPAKNPDLNSAQIANQIFHWLARVRRTELDPPRWPIAIDTPDQFAANLYSGEAGIFLFLDQYAAATADPQAAELTDELGKFLAGQLARDEATQDLGLFTGATGLAHVLLKAHDRTSVHMYSHAIDRHVQLLADRQRVVAQQPQLAIAWNDSTDIISGASGIGLFLLAAHARGRGAGKGLPLAVAAGDGLLLQAQEFPLPGGAAGLRWQMQPDFPREMPNYSHGTAGVCDFLIRLHAACADPQDPSGHANYDGRFARAAAAGGRYLVHCTQQSRQPPWIPHHFPGGEDLIYWGWCHGPTGTAAVLRRLNDYLPQDQGISLAQQAAARLLAAKPSSQRGEGFWDNPGVCCGSAGVGLFLLNEYRTTHDARYLNEAQQIAADLLRRATRDSNDPPTEELSWTTAEHRVRPEFRQTQTGLMQGAAGIGLFFLQLDAAERGVPRFDAFEDLLH